MITVCCLCVCCHVLAQVGRLFELKARKSSFSRELCAAITVFLTVSEAELITRVIIVLHDMHGQISAGPHPTLIYGPYPHVPSLQMSCRRYNCAQVELSSQTPSTTRPLCHSMPSIKQPVVCFVMVLAAAGGSDHCAEPCYPVHQWWTLHCG